MNEIWKSTDFDGYEVSNLGRVRSFKRYPNGRLLKQSDYAGYLHAGLVIDGKQKMCLVHRLVAIAFIPNPENKPEVNHIDGNKFNNCVDNLSWATSSENQRHAYATGLQVGRQGEKHHGAKLTAEQVIYVRDNPDNLSLKQLAEKFDVSDSTIGLIQRGKRWQSAGGSVRERIELRTPDKLRAQIRAEYQAGVRGHGYHALAKKFGVSVPTVAKIIHESA